MLEQETKRADELVHHLQNFVQSGVVILDNAQFMPDFHNPFGYCQSPRFFDYEERHYRRHRQIEEHADVGRDFDAARRVG